MSDVIQISIGGNVTDSALGKNIYQVNLNQIDRKAIRELVATFKGKIIEEIPQAEQIEMGGKLEELETSLTGDKTDLSATAKIINWLKARFPGIANTIVSVLVNPLIGKLAESISAEALEKFKEILNL